MNPLRRTFLNGFGAAGALSISITTGLLKPWEALAAEWNKSAFEALTMTDALKSVGGAGATESKDIQIKAPDHAENGAAVQLEVTSKIAGTTSLAIFVEKNPRPLIADCEFSNGAEPYIFFRTKMGESSRIRVLARAGGKTYFATKEVSVTSSGC
ncbi:MAG: thiosulfate oxidation carrier protein SoxY [Rhodocyclales bacterium]|nr:thiosulfate oxidation carrier protein SoxY [Rhodocyclales bacterium]